MSTSNELMKLLNGQEQNFVYEPLTIIITYVCHIFQWIIRCNSNNIIIKYEAFKSSLHISKINTKPLHTKHFLNRRMHLILKLYNI